MRTVNNQHRVYIGLGSNLDDPQHQIDSAVDTLKNSQDIFDVRCSHYYGSQAIGPGEQPDYINAAVECLTSLSPLALLAQLQQIENAHGRQRKIRWGARTLDLDLLLYDDICINEANLQIPHPELQNRNFVLYPLQDLNPTLVFPDGTVLATIMSSITMDGLYRMDTLAAKTAAGNVNK